MPDLWHGPFRVETSSKTQILTKGHIMYTITVNGQTISLPDGVKAVFTSKGLEIINPITPQKPETIQPKIETSHQTVNTAALTQTVRSGNGHKIAKVRSLSDHEKDRIRKFFQAVNGEIRPDSCRRLWESMTQEPDSKDISVFQVTGFVTYMHSEVMGGLASVRDLPRYMAYLQSHREMWLKYNSPKYAAMRVSNHVNHELVKILDFVQ